MNPNYPQSRGELEHALTRLLENAVGITITETNRAINFVNEYDIDFSDILWRINRELGICVSEAEIEAAKSFNYSIEDLIELTTTAWRRSSGFRGENT
jgi:hypothetical protein